MKKELTKKHLLGYALGDLGECMTFSVMGSFLTRYYVNVAMIDVGFLAILTFVWKFWDAMTNPMVGMFVDKAYAKKQYKRGKFRTWMFRATPLIAITAILTFTAPSWVEGMSKLVVVFVTYLLYQLAYNLFNIPYGSLLTAMSKTDEERAKLSSARGVGGMLGAMLPVSLFPLIISYFESNPQMGYGVGITVCAAAGFVGCSLGYLFTEERTLVVQKKEAQSVAMSDVIETIRKNRAFLAMMIHGICQGGLMAVSQTLGTYMFSDVLGNLAIMSVSTLAVLPLSVLVLTFSPALTKRMGMVNLIRKSLIAGVVVYVVLFILHITTNVNVWTHIILSSLGSSCLSVGNMMQWGLVGETIDYNEYLLGTRIEGTIYGTFNMLRRLGSALGASSCVALLGWIGYDASLSNLGLPQSPETILGIKVMCVLVPAIMALGSWAAFRYLWNITPEIKEKMIAAKSL